MFEEVSALDALRFVPHLEVKFPFKIFYLIPQKSLCSMQRLFY